MRQRLAAAVRRWSRSERLVMAAVGIGALHHLDHVLRFDHSGWPFRAEVSPFTHSLAVYPLIGVILALRGRPWVRAALMALVYVAVQAAHVLVEPPSHQYGTWADGYGTTPSGATVDNLLGVASPFLGVVSGGTSLLLSAVTIAAVVSLVADALHRSPVRHLEVQHA